MKTVIIFLLSLCPIFLFSQTTKKVLIIGIDGCRPDALEFANTPNLDQLINNGLYSPHALNDDITISGPGWSSIICGVNSDKHLVTGNDFTINDYENYPSIFKLIDEIVPELETVSICHWGPINDFIVQEAADFKLTVSSDQEVSDQAVNYLTLNDPDLIFLHFDDCDGAGHSYGFSQDVPEYVSAIESVDALVGPVINAIQQRPMIADEEWIILVTTDHGGSGFSHGGNTIGEQQVFVIASGDNIPTTQLLRESTTVSDNPFNCLQDEVELVFDGINSHVQIPTNSVFDFGSAHDFTIECRVRATASGDVAIVGNKDWDSGANKGFVFSFKFPNGPEWKVNIGDGVNRADINTGGSIADNEWHTLSVSFDRDGLMRMYQDGVFIDEADISAIGDITTNAGLFFGTDIFESYGYTGSISEVRCWNTVLDPAAINDWHCSFVDNSHPDYGNLIGYWKLNEGTGTIDAIDYSPNGINGDIVDATWDLSDSITIYDYSNTPRLPDIPITALTHLCIPIDTEWDLDGNSLIPECVVSSDADVILTPSDITLFPNPIVNQFTIQGDLSSFKLQILDSMGAVYQTISSNQNSLVIDISSLPQGMYFVLIAHKTNGILRLEKILKL